MEENKTPKKRDALVHQTCPYKEINPTWPTKGRHILAQYTDEAVLVYQAYCPAVLFLPTAQNDIPNSLISDRSLCRC